MLHLLHQELPNLQCINFDLPHVIKNMKPINNIKMVGGDMFKVDTLPECDVIFTKNVLHDWSNEKCVEVLKNFHIVLKDDGIVMNVNLHLAEPGEAQDEWENFSTDVVMLYIFGEAKDRTVSEYVTKLVFKLLKLLSLDPKQLLKQSLLRPRSKCYF